MDRIRILYFVEDRAQEGFLKALVKRIAQDQGIQGNALFHDVRSARGGSRIINEFRNFLRDNEKGPTSKFDILVVAIDGNCRGHNERVKQLQKYAKGVKQIVQDRILYAIPDPHIERWYLMDQRAFNTAVEAGSAPEISAYKCKKDYYKEVLRRALREAGVESLLGGPEYAEMIVANMNFQQIAQENAGFGHFVDDLRRVFRAFRRTV